MCYNCGCSIPQDDMGNAGNITDSTFVQVGELLGKNEQEIKEMVLAWLNGQRQAETAEQEFDKMFEKAAATWGQSVDEAKKETKKLLNATLKK